MTWNCVTLTPQGRIYNYEHHWDVIYYHHILCPIPWYYRCLNCKLRLSRREYKAGQHILYKDLPNYDIEE